MHYEQRAQHCSNPTAKRCFEIMAKKHTNLALAADVLTSDELLRLADQVGPHIAIFKTHIDILTDFSKNTITELKKLEHKHDFLIFEDRKFADIGNTVRAQYEQGIYHIAQWSPITNAHLIPGPGIIEGLRGIGLPKGNALLLLAQMSSQGALATSTYTEANIKAAQQYDDFVIGFICQEKLINDPKFLHMSPGIQLHKGSDALGQQYNTPETAIVERGVDVIIVGRGITHADDQSSAAREYQQAGWNAYLKRLSQRK